MASVPVLSFPLMLLRGLIRRPLSASFSRFDEATERAASEIQGQRAGLGESPILEAGVTADVLGLAVGALRRL